MLVLTRKINESVMIGDEVEVCLLEIKGDKVRLGIRAPRSVTVHRKEVYEEMFRTGKPPAAIVAARGLRQIGGAHGRQG